MTDETRRVLLEIDNVRIREYDSMNVQIERYEARWNPKAKEETSDWRFKAYSATIFSALARIVTKEYLVDENAVQNAKSLLNEVQASNEKVLEAIDRLDRERRKWAGSTGFTR